MYDEKNNLSLNNLIKILDEYYKYYSWKKYALMKIIYFIDNRNDNDEKDNEDDNDNSNNFTFTDSIEYGTDSNDKKFIIKNFNKSSYSEDEKDDEDKINLFYNKLKSELKNLKNNNDECRDDISILDYIDDEDNDEDNNEDNEY